MTMATPLAEVAARVGEDAFLVPCEWGTKKPLVTYVERPFEGTKSPAYRAMFEAEPTNIAVYWGVRQLFWISTDEDGGQNAAVLISNNPPSAR